MSAAAAEVLSGTKIFSDRINRIEVSATMAITAEALRLKSTGIDLADFGAGEPHFATPQHIKQAAIDAIEKNLTKYTAVAGIPEVRKAICARHAADFGTDYKIDECCFATGGKQALFNAIEVLVDHGDEVIVPVPYWVSYKDIIQFAGGTPVFVKTDEAQDFRLTAAAVEAAITERTRCIILNSPTNPAGSIIPAADMESIIRLAHRRGIVVLLDECYNYLNFEGEGKPTSGGSVTDCRDSIVICGTLSKTYAMTGWRAGFALGPKPIIAAISKLQSQSTSNASTPVQYAAIAALNGSQDCVEEMRKGYVELRDRILAGFKTIPGITCTVPQGAFYVYPNVSAYFDKKDASTASQIASRLLSEAHVVCVPGEAFGTEEHLRFSYATSADVIDKGLERMRTFFGGLV
ncbi:aspartate/tyrosine/aromatic aminotransferase [Terriglobus roseus DSM 18391]|uniref:Aspartate/tyrosine/aromatic aminotransferase n=1 Tax=Terriglobus roseus (strain DSM 18391 / NRRL B-41598 / KBS 63) TaxID=926566 RepID=I3ZL83_TERRK|nr:pyridoxal phosphate-dependent aminotransferase [Terriglobus roseus]AFL90001.1 aspartate/tyrosine/aromatic aminotransferase [Terriglobus roseus DSM 18391]